MRASGTTRVAAHALVLAATIRAALALARAPSWTVDDAFIVARYAEHLARHHTVAWNLGDPPVEGFTSLLALLVATSGELLASAPIRTTVVVTVVAYLASGYLLLWLARSLRLPLLAGAIGAVLHLSVAEHVTHATSGLETELFVALGLALAASTARALSPKTSVLAPAVIALLLAITRPEGAAASFAALAMVAHARGLENTWRSLVAGFGLPALAVTVWRWTTFRALVPNTFYAKSGTWNRSHLHDLHALVSAHYLETFVAAAALAAIALVGLSKRIDLKANDKRMALVASVTLLAHAVAYARSEPIMDYARRFAIHDVAWLDVLVVIAVGTALRALGRGRLRAPAGVLMVLAMVAAVRRGAAEEIFQVSWAHKYARVMSEAVMPAGEWVRTMTPPDATIAVHVDAGYIPYRSRRRTIDFGLLNDATLARSPHTPAVALAHFMAVRPDYYVVTESSARAYDDVVTAILDDPRFVRDYVLIRKGDYAIYARRP